MGYTGAVFKEFYGTDKGLIVSFSVMVLWIALPLLYSLKKFNRKDL
jgi:Cu-processing system permease protein